MKRQNYLLGTAIVLAVALLIIIAHQQKTVRRDLSKIIKTELIQSQQKRRTCMEKHGKVYVFYPCDDKGKPFADLKKKLDAKVKAVKGADYYFMGISYVDSDLQDTQQATIYQHSYNKKVFGLTKVKGSSSKSFYVKSNHKVLKLTDLLSRSQNLKKDLSSQVSSLLKAKKIDKKTRQGLLKALQQKKLSQASYSYAGGQLSLTVKDQQLNLPIKQLYSILNPHYLKGDDLQIYRNYKHGQGRLEKMSGHVVALSFDDGPNPITTPQVLKILKRYHVKATFFLVGQNVLGNEQLMRKMLKDGHELGNHSWDHSQLNRLKESQISWELGQTQDAIIKATGQAPTVFRPPYGATSEAVRKATQLYEVLWDVDTLDWKNHNTQAILEKVKTQTKDGSVILMHDVHQSTVNALPALLDYLSSKGYRFVTTSELYGYA
ncbi:polysaccharide deacetylase family protein [Streptococcus dentapri]|uniref:Polysaccharide deacetylase family protein n=1 Tax=Streptococcus dentapri TaxID=573564 RepID=A0ABV8CYH1_9STRE